MEVFSLQVETAKGQTGMLGWNCVALSFESGQRTQELAS